MADVAQLFDQWAAALARGEQPDPLEFIGRAGPAADELRAMMERFLRARPRADPDPEAVAAARAWIAGDAPLVDLRARRGVRVDEVVDAVVAEFALPPDKRPTVKRYYHQLESGALDPTRASRALLDLLTRVLGAPAASVAAWRPRPLALAPAYRPQGDAAAVPPLMDAARAAREPFDDDEQVRKLFISER